MLLLFLFLLAIFNLDRDLGWLRSLEFIEQIIVLFLDLGFEPLDRLVLVRVGVCLLLMVTDSPQLFTVKLKDLDDQSLPQKWGDARILVIIRVILNIVPDESCSGGDLTS